MGRKYITINTDVELDVNEILNDIDTEDLIQKLEIRNDVSVFDNKIKELAIDNCSWKSYDNLKLSILQEMKLEYFLTVMDKYSLEHIETFLK